MRPLKGNRTGASEPEPLSTKQQRIAELAKEAADMSFTSLNHLIDLPWLRRAYAATRKDGAVGVDGQTAEEYEKDLQSNLQSLLDRAKSGAYRAPPVRRVHIPKGQGEETRPVGIPTFEDKILQRAVVMVLQTIYEQDFLDCSYGFRPGRSAHQALHSLREQIMAGKGCGILEVDIRRCFDTLDHARLRELLQQRVRDGVLLRLIGKWLNAGVLEGGIMTFPEAGTPQGGVISPLLANIYLHYVLDVWFADTVKPRLQGHAFLIRYADDFVIGFALEADARRVLEVLPKRLGKYGLTLHPDKTRLVSFRRPGRDSGDDAAAKDKPGTFDLLGFRHYWCRSRKGYWVVMRKTAPSSFRRALRKIARWCRWRRHDAIAEQHQVLSRKVRGHYAYFGITCNNAALKRFFRAVVCRWRKWLSRRKRGSPIPWPKFAELLKRFPLPPPVIVHSVYRHAANA